MQTLLESFACTRGLPALTYWCSATIAVPLVGGPETASEAVHLQVERTLTRQQKRQARMEGSYAPSFHLNPAVLHNPTRPRPKTALTLLREYTHTHAAIQ